MKILHVIHSFPPRSHGGTETYVERVARAQRSQRHEVTVLSGSDAGEHGEELLDGIPVIRLEAPVRALENVLYGSCETGRQALADVLAERRPDVVHLHHWHNITNAAVGECVRQAIPAVVSLHDLYATCPLFFRLQEGADSYCLAGQDRSRCVQCIASAGNLELGFAAQAVARREEIFRTELLGAAAVLALSDAQRTFLMEVPYLADIPIRALPLPLPQLKATGSIPAAAAAARLRIVSWGGLIRGKGMGTLIEACERLSARGQVSVHHYGRVLDESFRAELVSAAAGTRLAFHGRYSSSEQLAQFPTYDLAIFPSLYLETHGIVVDEALNLGLPVIVSDHGAPPSRVGGRGRVFPAGDAAALAEILEELLANRALLDQMRSAPRVPQPTLELHVMELDAVYASALGG